MQIHYATEVISVNVYLSSHTGTQMKEISPLT